MSYAYEFDETCVGDVRFVRENYATVHEALRILREKLAGWNKRALQHGAATEAYKAEVDHLDMMIDWGAEEFSKGLPYIVVNGISVGSRRYQKAALLLMVHKREHERTEMAREGWPSGTLQALDAAIDRIRRLADAIQQEPSEVARSRRCRPDRGGNLVSGSPARLSVARQAARSNGSARGRAIDIQPSTFLSTI